jgi:hypothetical protein
LVNHFVPHCKWCTRFSLWITVGLEVLVGALLLETRSVYAAVAAALLFAVMGFVLEMSHRIAPQKPCGCLGRLSQSPSTQPYMRAIRPFALLILSVVCACIAGSTTASPGYGADLRFKFASVVAFLVSMTLVVVVSPELRMRKLEENLRLHVRSRSVSSDVRLIRRSYSWKTLHPYLVGSDFLDEWLDGEWRFVQWEARADGKEGSIIFAVLKSPRTTRVHGTFIETSADESIPRILARVNG